MIFPNSFIHMWLSMWFAVHSNAFLITPRLAYCQRRKNSLKARRSEEKSTKLINGKFEIWPIQTNEEVSHDFKKDYEYFFVGPIDCTLSLKNEIHLENDQFSLHNRVIRKNFNKSIDILLELKATTVHPLTLQKLHTSLGFSRNDQFTSKLFCNHRCWDVPSLQQFKRQNMGILYYLRSNLPPSQTHK